MLTAFLRCISQVFILILRAKNFYPNFVDDNGYAKQFSLFSLLNCFKIIKTCALIQVPGGIALGFLEFIAQGWEVYNFQIEVRRGLLLNYDVALLKVSVEKSDAAVSSV